MCGITGAWQLPDTEKVRAMMARLRHRGPDGSGVQQCGPGMLGHRRLAIMDPEEGKQPYLNESRTLSLAANGEIYNWQALRSQLGAHQFGSQADTEVALHLFEEGGEASVEQLDGMFALAWSGDQKLVLARDPIGIKPLYYAHKETPKGPAILFASEMKALLDEGERIVELPPGSIYRSDAGIRQFYQLPELEPEVIDVEPLVRQVRETLTESVEKRLMSDVPLGAFLSGGLDSSIIAALAKARMGELHTFSVGTEGSPDLAAARRVAEYLGTIHHEYLFTADEVKAELPRMIYGLESFDQDLVRSVIPTYLTARLASDYVKVILTGEGADELFAGYTYYRDYHDPQALQRELRRSVGAMHNVNLQRVDRMTMAHSVEGRVPFLDTAMIALAQRIPPELKLYRAPDGTRVEKWILRKAFEDLLPHEIVWRDKAQFDEGSGTTDMLQALIEEGTAKLDAEAYRAAHPEARLRSAEECFYYQQFEDVFSRPELMLPCIGRWAQAG